MAGSGAMPVLELRVQMRRRPARVSVFRDRVEWSPIAPSILSRGIVAAATGDDLESFARSAGDLEADGVPIALIASVVAERAGMHTRLSLVTRERTIVMEVARPKAARMQQVLRALMEPVPPADR